MMEAPKPTPEQLAEELVSNSLMLARNLGLAPPEPKPAEQPTPRKRRKAADVR